MLYLIKSAGYDNNEDLIHLLKIGYTEDSNWEKRLTMYKLHNPTCKLLYTIPKVSLDKEGLLHYRFKDYKFPDYGNEWFIYNESIVDYFKTHTTLESLGDLEEKPSKIISPKTIERERLRKWLEENEVSEEVRKVLEMFTSTDYSFYDKMRFLCESSFSEDTMTIILDQIPLTYKNFYLTLGPNRCRANGYNVTRIKKEYNDLSIDKTNLDTKIQSEFKVGEKYLMSDIKERLREIYSLVGYNKSPKATDLSSYFEIKKCKISINGGKESNGFKILARK